MNEDAKKFMDLFDPLRNQDGGLPLGKFGGHWFPVYMPLIWSKIRNFSVRPNDIFICSFPKTGTNWINYLVYMIETGNVEKTKADYKTVLLETPLRGGTAGAALDELAADPNPRRICTHLPINLLPLKTFDARVIYVYRNVKDTLVSDYHHHLSLQTTAACAYNDTFNNFARRFMMGEVYGGPYENHLKGYWKANNSGKQILFLHYEDLKKDLLGGIRQIAEFLGRNLDDNTMKQIAEAASFQRMKSNNAVNWSALRRAGFWKADQEFLRKGEVGDWRNYFNDEPSMLAEFDSYIKANYPMILFPDFEQT